jgi:hypothetical protein
VGDGGTKPGTCVGMQWEGMKGEVGDGGTKLGTCVGMQWEWMKG